MEFQSRPKVALLIEPSRRYGRDLLRGAALFARTRGNWSILYQEMTIDADLPDWIRSGSVDGVIGRVDSHTINPLRGLGVPIVDVRCRKSFDRVPQVETDDHAVAQLAFEHLWERGFRRFGFCGFQNAHFSEARLSAFRALVGESGSELSIYESPGGLDAPLTRIEEAGLTDVDAMSTWLQTLKAPSGVFVCNDIRGQQVLNACQTLHISVPDDLGVIGVDDDDAICPLCDPPLSSVTPDAESIGFRAAEILSEMMNGKTIEFGMEVIAPIGVSERVSTQVVAVEDRELARVCRFIREYGCQGIDVNDVVSASSLSRRQLERRFQQQLGRTPHEEITETQVRRVKQLLRESEMTLEQIAPLAGYKHKEQLGAVFKRCTGRSPGQFRKQLREEIG